MVPMVSSEMDGNMNSYIYEDTQGVVDMDTPYITSKGLSIEGSWYI